MELNSICAFLNWSAIYRQLWALHAATPWPPAFLLRIHKIGHLSIGNKALRVLCIVEPES